MPLTNAEQTIVDRFNKATSAIADKIRVLTAGAVDSPEFVTELNKLADGLDQLGANGSVPPAGTP